MHFYGALILSMYEEITDFTVTRMHDVVVADRLIAEIRNSSYILCYRSSPASTTVIQSFCL